MRKTIKLHHEKPKADQKITANIENNREKKTKSSKKTKETIQKERINQLEERLEKLEKHISKKLEPIYSSMDGQKEEFNTFFSDQKEEYERLYSEINRLRKEIESLLPGATSAGLASAFKERKDSFKYAKIIWPGLFLASMIILTSLPYILQPILPTEKSTWVDIINRILFTIPLIWTGWYAGTRHTQTLRAEEHYAHKEVMSKSFIGYLNQMNDLDSSYLVNKTVECLSKDPGEAYK